MDNGKQQQYFSLKYGNPVINNGTTKHDLGNLLDTEAVEKILLDTKETLVSVYPQL